MIEDFQKICRTCLEEIAEFKYLFNVQYINEEKMRLSEILTACTSIEVLENDNLPKQVCIKCENNILNAFSFQQQCHKSDLVLRAFASQSVQSQLIELKPLVNIEASLNSSIQFENILSNDTSKQDQVNHLVKEVENFKIPFNASGQITQYEGSESDCLVNNGNSLGSVNVNFSEQEHTSYSFNEENEISPSHQSEEGERIHKELQTDIIDETLQPLFPCEAEGCVACFTTLEDLKEHSKKHLPKYSYCKICNKTFSSASTLSRHVTSKHQPERKTHLCSDCGKGFARSDDLKRHIRIHTGERPFSCEKCGKAFAQSFRLLEHMRSHSNIKNFICAVCGKAFARYSCLLAHNKTHNKVKSHKCPKCDKRLCGPGSLAMHMKIHTGQKDFVCNFCKKCFTSTSNLIVHKRAHTGERPYSCNTCGKSFPDHSRLNVHSRIHSGEKPYVCSYCGRGCVSSTQLKRHTRIHTGEKPYQCNLCTKSFKRSEDLKRHIKVHTGEKPYTCNICNNTFSQNGSYAAHMKSHNHEDHYAYSKIEDGKETILQYL